MHRYISLVQCAWQPGLTSPQKGLPVDFSNGGNQRDNDTFHQCGHEDSWFWYWYYSDGDADTKHTLYPQTQLCSDGVTAWVFETCSNGLWLVFQQSVPLCCTVTSVVVQVSNHLTPSPTLQWATPVCPTASPASVFTAGLCLNKEPGGLWLLQKVGFIDLKDYKIA